MIVFGDGVRGHLWQSKLLFFGGNMLKNCWSSGEYPFRSSHDHVDWKMIPLKSALIVKQNCGKR